MDLEFEKALIADLQRHDREFAEAVAKGERHGDYLFVPQRDGWLLFGPWPDDVQPVLAELPAHPPEARAAIIAAYEAGFENGPLAENVNVYWGEGNDDETL